MLFNSLQFAIFFIIVYCLYLLLNHKQQNRMLLVASYIFYGAWDWRFLSLIVISTVLDYFCGIKIYESDVIKKRKLFLFFSIFGNLAILGFFKYFDFFTFSLQTLVGYFGVTIEPRFLNLVLPIGISFYTFQTMSYTIDIYKKEMEPTRKFFDFALFVSFFPQLVAGPIERAKNLLPQVLKNRKVDIEKLGEGFRLILWGLFKKIVVADRLAIYVDTVYGNVYHHHSITFLVATFFFAFQIYCDFSGYSDIARGLAKLMGFDIMINFRSPYFAKTIREFWQRWHISLSTWLRDYVYIPLGGNRKGRLIVYRNVLITMVLGGLWHGANWTFVIWGALHGIYIIAARVVQGKFGKALSNKKGISVFNKIAGMIFTFSIVLAAWIFFRAASLKEALYIFKSIFDLPLYFFVGESRSPIVQCFMGIAFVVLMDYLSRRKTTGDVLRFKPQAVQWAVYYVVIFGIILFGVHGGDQFIYFQF